MAFFIKRIVFETNCFRAVCSLSKHLLTSLFIDWSAVRRRTNPHVEVTQGGKAVLGVCLRKLGPQVSFGCAFREKKTERTSTPGGCKSGPWGVQNGLREASGRLFCAIWAQLGRNLARLGPTLAHLKNQNGAKMGSSWHPKSNKNRSQ